MQTRILTAFLIVLLLVSAASGQTPLGSAFTYQGQLKNAGTPASGSFNMVFKLWNDPTLSAPANQVGPTLTFDGVGGNPPLVSVINGLFTSQLDFGATAFSGIKRWLSISVNGTALSSRQELTAAPNAQFTLNADRLDGLDSTAFLQSVPVPLTLSGSSSFQVLRVDNASSLSNATGILGWATATTGSTNGVVGRNASTAGKGVFGDAQATTGITYGVSGRSSSTDGCGVFGYAAAPTGVTCGGSFQSISTDGAGVVGWASAGTGTTNGVSGSSSSTSGRGVYGMSSAATGFTSGGSFQSVSSDGTGVFGWSSAATGSNYGVSGLTNSVNGTGVFGLANATSGTTSGVSGESVSASDGRGVYGLASNATGLNYGVYGASNSTTGRGVFGYSTAATGINIGVYGQSGSPDGKGVVGHAFASSGASTGGDFQSNSPAGRGVFGFASASAGATTFGVSGQSNSPSGRGVHGLAASASGVCYGVSGQSNSASGFSVYAFGNVGASGLKPFRIDHPDDPANKYLLHYAAESPEVMNFYSETVTLDQRGEAVVNLPHYFAKINTKPRYQLTAIGAAMPMLHVAREIDEAAMSAGAKAEPGEAAPACSFRIAGGAPLSKVSWEVKAVRNDRWVRTHGAPVEVEKQGLEKGTYQHPELYDQPVEKGVNYDNARTDVPARRVMSDATRR